MAIVVYHLNEKHDMSEIDDQNLYVEYWSAGIEYLYWSCSRRYSLPLQSNFAANRPETGPVFHYPGMLGLENNNQSLLSLTFFLKY